MSSRRNWFVIALHEKRLPALFGTDVDDVGQQFDVRFSTDEVDRSAGAQDHSDGNRSRKNKAGEATFKIAQEGIQPPCTPDLLSAGAEVAKRFHDLLFDNQPSESGPFPDTQDLLDLAVEAGAEEDEVSEGILEVTMRDWVDDATAAAIEAGVQGTPTVILDGEVVQGLPQDILDAVLEATA